MDVSNAAAVAVWILATLAALAPAAAQPMSRLPQEPVTPLPSWRPVRPNVVYILCDDLGYGDVHALNPDRGKIPTPNMDRLITEGMSFTDAHASSSLCSPSRYTILTGRYDWRTRLQAGVLGAKAPPLIAPGRLTVASMLKQQGYATAGFGKWHLGWQWAEGTEQGRLLDGPLQHGFDRYFESSPSPEKPPYAFIDDDHLVPPPGAGGAATYDHALIVPTLLDKADAYLKERGTAADHRPFFLYVALTCPHTPLVPTPQFKGKSPLGPYGDFVMETDWAVGQVVRAVDDAGLASNTIVCLASDNGCAPYIGVKQLEAKGHYPSAQFRGYKNDIWDGGHREPFVVRWPGTVAAGSHSDQTVCLGDLMATLAQVTGARLPSDAGEDSFSLLPVLLGVQHGPVRYAEVQHSGQGYFAMRRGKWKLELCAGSGGWAAPREAKARQEHLPAVQLYDLEADVGEQHNVQADHPDVVRELTALLEQSVADGRTTPGPTEANDVKVEIRKAPGRAAANVPPEQD